MDFNIRKYIPSDFDAVLECNLYLQEYERNLEKDRLPAQEVAHEYLQSLLVRKNSLIYVAESNNRVIGFISFCLEKEDSILQEKHQSVYISDIAVLPEYQKKGVGQKLLSQAEDFCHENSINRILISAIAKNESAKNAYVKNGFREYEISFIKEL